MKGENRNYHVANYSFMTRPPTCNGTKKSIMIHRNFHAHICVVNSESC